MSTDTALIAELSHPSHSCLIYETPADQIAVTCEFLARGLTRGELCVFLEQERTLDLVRVALADSSIDADAEEKRGALVLTSNRDFLDNTHFNGERTISFLEQTVKQALNADHDPLFF